MHNCFLDSSGGISQSIQVCAGRETSRMFLTQTSHILLSVGPHAGNMMESGVLEKFSQKSWIWSVLSQPSVLFRTFLRTWPIVYRTRTCWGIKQSLGDRVINCRIVKFIWRIWVFFIITVLSEFIVKPGARRIPSRFMRGVVFTVINNGLEVYNRLVPVKSSNINQEQEKNFYYLSFGNRGVYYPKFSMIWGENEQMDIKQQV